ncbi:inactive pancreatic lipase-related protein 1-like [Galendromus occidentalis]|uniref:Inactive pancreatic lipase-related protein 1-like n=1 Tax=Galendromus occidentalis TaxID=34638 RepID=A0AAJ6QQ58_9ACAR|nr:inactive pancreatic lipase-related protein 1-like [Galendromus occidentalis]
MAFTCGLRIIIALGLLLETRAENLTRCYGALGCFSTGGAFSDPRALRHLVSVLPWSRERIRTQILLYTETNRDKPDRFLWNTVSPSTLRKSKFNSSKKLVIMVHGYLQIVDIDKTQLMIKDTFIDYLDSNFIFVSWSRGSMTGYWTAAANTRIVGAEIALLIEKIIETFNYRKSDIHLLGHSLGGHIIGYAGRRMPGLRRLTALDPADPFFQNGDPEIRIDPSDGDFVEALHTDSRVFVPAIPIGGYGMWDPVGHVDVYVNGGVNQPACLSLQPAKVVLTSTNEKNPFMLARELVVCHHMYVVRLVAGIFVRDGNCALVSYQCANFTDFLNGRCTDCGPDTAKCFELGKGGEAYRRYRDAHDWPRRFFILTHVGPPYCMHHYEIRLRLSRETDVTEAQIAFVFEDVDGSLSIRAMVHDGHVRLVSREEAQAWVVGVVSTIKPQIKTIRLSWISLDRNKRLKLAPTSRLTVYYMNRIIPTRDKNKYLEDFCGPEGLLPDREEIIFAKC